MCGLIFNHFVRNLTKYTYKLLKPSTYKHNRRYWPFYRVVRNASGQIDQVFFRNTLIADHTLNLKNKHSKCMLIATGPSIKKIPDKFFKYEKLDYIGVNGAIALNEVTFQHYVIIDHDFVQNRFDLVERVLDTACNFFTTARCLDYILRKVKIEQIRCQFKIIEITSNCKNELFMGNTIHVDEKVKSNDFYNGFGFSTHMYDTVFDYYTVAYTALQIMSGLNYQHIYIAGVDMNNFDLPRFYETLDAKQPTLLNQHTQSIIAAFETAAYFFESQKVSVYNLSPHSLIKSFNKLTLEQDTIL